MLELTNDESRPLKNVFALRNPEDLLRKLVWEVEQLRVSLHPDTDEFPWALAPAYRAYNCAVTAWHMTDWTWQSCTDGQRSRIAEKFGFSMSSENRKNLTRFYDAVAASSRELHICREIANGSKHMKLEKDDGAVVARAEWARVVEPTEKRKVGDYIFTLHIDDDGRHMTAINVFIKAGQYWENLLGELFFIEGTRYVHGRPVTYLPEPMSPAP